MTDLLTARPEIKNWEEYDAHRAVYSFVNDAIGLLGFIAVHRKNADRPSFGATRLWHYQNQDCGLHDALRLARTMSYKAALAGLPYGGAKAVIIGNGQWQSRRPELLAAYAAVVDELNGVFITGTDVGLDQNDLRAMGQNSKNFVGFNDNATEFTALGVFSSIQVCLERVFGSLNITGRRFAIQGVGKIGTALARLLYQDAAAIFVSEVNEEHLRKFIKEFPRCLIASPEEIHKQKVDVFSPCALSNSITAKIAGELACPIVCGGANNQLEREEVGSMLSAQGIIYAPDYVVNAGGLISVVDEYENEIYVPERVRGKVLRVRDTISKILDADARFHYGANVAANMMAEKIFNGYD